jgi:DNA-binding response OmpR family regulator
LDADCRNILVVDDEVKIIEVVKSYLESRGFTVFCALNAAGAFDTFERERIALIILDLMLPDMPGEEICAAIRRKSRVPIIMLTARVEEENILKGLAIGADDYITKPFSLKELSARAEAALRRSGEYTLPPDNRLVFGGGLEIDFDKRSVINGAREVSLTPTEFRILEVLVKSPNKVFTRDQLIDCALGGEFDGYVRAIDSHIKNIRQKLEDNPKNPAYILTIHGVGYRFGGTGGKQ